MATSPPLGRIETEVVLSGPWFCVKSTLRAAENTPVECGTKQEKSPTFTRWKWSVSLLFNVEMYLSWSIAEICNLRLIVIRDFVAFCGNYSAAFYCAAAKSWSVYSRPAQTQVLLTTGHAREECSFKRKIVVKNRTINSMTIDKITARAGKVALPTLAAKFSSCHQGLFNLRSAKASATTQLPRCDFALAADVAEPSGAWFASIVRHLWLIPLISTLLEASIRYATCHPHWEGSIEHKNASQANSGAVFETGKIARVQFEEKAKLFQVLLDVERDSASELRALTEHFIFMYTGVNFSLIDIEFLFIASPRVM